MVDRRRIISADSHVTIPNELVHPHLPKKLRDKVVKAEAFYAAAMLEAKPQKASQAKLKGERSTLADVAAMMPTMGKGAPWPAAGRPGSPTPSNGSRTWTSTAWRPRSSTSARAAHRYWRSTADRVEALRPSTRPPSSGRRSTPSGSCRSTSSRRRHQGAVKEVERVVADHGKAVAAPAPPP